MAMLHLELGRAEPSRQHFVAHGDVARDSGAGSEFTQTLLRDCGSVHSSCAGCCTNKRITDMPVASTEMHPFWFMPVCFGFKAITKPQLLF